MIELLKRVVAKQTHPYYERTTEVANYWSKVVTGKMQDCYIVSYKERETELQKEQRIKLYNPRTKDVAGRSIAIFDKVDNSDPIAETISFPDLSDEVNKSQVLDIDRNISDFKDGSTLKRWLSENYQNKNATDPNAWMVLTYYMGDNGDVKTTADIINSDCVLDYNHNK